MIAMRNGMRKSGLMILAAAIVLAVFAAPVHAVESDTELMGRAKAILGTLPAAMTSPENPITPEKVTLGRMLFWEPRISVDGIVSCAKCHHFGLYGTDGLRKAIGNNCKLNPRNAPTVLNAASQISEHWIGNRTSVEDQAKQALVGPPSFGMHDYASVDRILKGMKEYVALFKAAFPGETDPVTADNFAKAVGAFERTLVTPSAFDDFLGGNASALTDRQKRGLRTFLDTGCMTCHFGPFIGGQMYQKFGLIEPYAKYTKSKKIDVGRFAVTKNPADKFVFKVPVLRNVAMTPPYFHDGSVDRLVDAVTIMAKIQLGRNLTGEQAGDIAAFLGSLTGRIPQEAMTVPVLPSEE